MNLTHGSSLNYERGELTATARAFLTHPTREMELELMRVVGNVLQIHGKEISRAQLISLLVTLCNEGYVPDVSVLATKGKTASVPAKAA